MSLISRAEVIRRAATMWPVGTVAYDQGHLHSNGYRQDCSGFISMCWAIPPNASPGGWGGLNTVSLVTGKWMREISPSELEPGDAVGICGVGTGGDDGHVVLFEKWLNDDPDDDRYWAYEQAGGQRGPVHRIITYPYNGASGPWKAWRYRDITEVDTMSDYTPYGKPAVVGPRGDSVMLADLWGQEQHGVSPYDSKSPSGRSAQLRRIEDDGKSALVKLDHLATGGIDVTELADALGPLLKLPTLPEIAKAVCDELARRGAE